jgi:hypothetical protein
MQVRYDPVKKIYRDCKWCYGKGCNQCEHEADAEYKRQFPNGPQPIAVARLDNHEEMAAMKRVFGADSLNEDIWSRRRWSFGNFRQT